MFQRYKKKKKKCSRILDKKELKQHRHPVVLQGLIWVSFVLSGLSIPLVTIYRVYAQPHTQALKERCVKLHYRKEGHLEISNEIRTKIRSLTSTFSTKLHDCLSPYRQTFVWQTVIMSLCNVHFSTCFKLFSLYVVIKPFSAWWTKIFFANSVDPD